MNGIEAEAYLLDHVEQEHAGLFDWRAMGHRSRALIHHAMPHIGSGHTHKPVVYIGGANGVQPGSEGSDL